MLDIVPRYGETVLWFEHDLFDQAMLLSLLHRLAALAPAPHSVSLVGVGRFPGIEPFRGSGQLTPEQLASLWSSRRRFGSGALELGRRSWAAYAAADPRRVEALLGEAEGKGSGLAELPLLTAALRCHLCRFPARRDRLSRVERATLAGIASGLGTPGELFRRVSD